MTADEARSCWSMSVPKRAFFYWEGKQPSELRLLSRKTFEYYNPEWEVEWFENEPHDPSLSEMTAVQRSDVFRYTQLAANGGVYLDTDIIFHDKFPSELLDCDVGITYDSTGRFHNIGILMGSPDNAFWMDVAKAAVERWKTADYKKVYYQLLGTPLINRLFWNECRIGIEEDCPDGLNAVSSLYPDHVFRNLPKHLVTPIGPNEISWLYSRMSMDFDIGIGLHWYGGDKQSRRYEQTTRDGQYDRWPCLMTDVIKVALEQTGLQRSEGGVVSG